MNLQHAPWTAKLCGIYPLSCTPISIHDIELLLFCIKLRSKNAFACLKFSCLLLQNKETYRAMPWPHGDTALLDVNLHTHGNIRGCTRNYETQKRKEKEQFFVLQNTCFWNNFFWNTRYVFSCLFFNAVSTSGLSVVGIEGRIKSGQEKLGKTILIGVIGIVF